MNALRKRRRAAEGWDHAAVVNHLLEHTDVVLALDDLNIAVVTLGHHGRALAGPGDAALANRPAFRPVPLMGFVVRAAVGLTLLSFRSHRGELAFGTGNDGRSQTDGSHDGVAREPELAGIVVHGQCRLTGLRIDVRRGAAPGSTTS